MVTQYDCEKSIKEAEEEFKKRFNGFKKIVENAPIKGKLQNLKVENNTFYLEYSPDSMVGIDAIIDGARSLGLNQGNIAFGGNIVKIGEFNKVEFEIKKGSVLNHTDVSDTGISLFTHSRVGELVITMYPDTQDKNLIKIEVNNQEKFNQLSMKEKKKIGRNLQFGGLSFCEAIEQGNFKRSGKFQTSEPSETVGFIPQDVKEEAKKVMENIGSADIKNTEEGSWLNKMQGKRTNESCGRGM